MPVTWTGARSQRNVLVVRDIVKKLKVGRMYR